MIESPGLLLTIAAFALLLGPLVFLHELGHYLAGRWFGVKAEVFSVGFGQEIAGFTDRRGTRWKFGWLPLGGYVKFAGDMSPASQPDMAWMSKPASERAQMFQSKPLWQRAIIVAAGPLANFLIAILILGGFAMVYGDAKLSPTVATVAPQSAAAQAGLVPGDRITALAGKPVADFRDMPMILQTRAGETVTIDFVRGDRGMSATTVIGTRIERDRFGNEYRFGLLGIGPGQPVYQPVGVLEAPVVAVRRTWQLLGLMVGGIGDIVTGRRSVAELGGPLRIADTAGQQLALGVPEFVFLIAFVSLNLGFINLLPVPMLDGGHLFFYALEAVRRRPVEPQVLEWAFRGGLVALLALMLLVTFNDLGTFGVWRNLAGLIG